MNRMTFVELVSKDGMDKRLAEVQSSIEGARDAALGAAQNVDGMLSQVSEALETTTDARDRIIEVLPQAEAAAAKAPDVFEAAAQLPVIQAALENVQAAQQVMTGVSGTPYAGTVNGVPVTGLSIGPGAGLIVTPAALINGDVLITGITIGGLA